jgi:uncharacterized OB-fold protein
VVHDNSSLFVGRCDECGTLFTYPTQKEMGTAMMAHKHFAFPANTGVHHITPPYVEPDDQVLSEPVFCFHPSRARINQKAPWFCVTCGETAGEDMRPITAEVVDAVPELGGEAEVRPVAKKEDKRESFLDFLFGGKS